VKVRIPRRPIPSSSVSTQKVNNNSKPTSSTTGRQDGSPNLLLRAFFFFQTASLLSTPLLSAFFLETFFCPTGSYISHNHFFPLLSQRTNLSPFVSPIPYNRWQSPGGIAFFSSLFCFFLEVRPPGRTSSLCPSPAVGGVDGCFIFPLASFPQGSIWYPLHPAVGRLTLVGNRVRWRVATLSLYFRFPLCAEFSGFRTRHPPSPKARVLKGSLPRCFLHISLCEHFFFFTQLS